MRVLVLTGLYPPYGLGGHEIHCQEICGKLRQRGFEIRILTSRYGVSSPRREADVSRLLNAYGFDGMPDWPRSLWERAWRDWEDARTLQREISRFRPDVIFIWVSHCLTRTLFSALAASRIPVVWQDGGDCVLKALKRRGRWLRFCEEKPANSLKRVLHRLALALSRTVTRGTLPQKLVFPADLTVYQCSRYCLEVTESRREIPLKKHLYIHPGVDLSFFKPAPRRPRFPDQVRLLCPGRIHECKGQVHAIRALRRICWLRPQWDIELWFTGKVQDADYGELLRREIETLELGPRVKFLGVVSREELSRLFRSCDIVLFTSVFQEPFGTVIAEAKACRRPVVGSPVGGAVEQMQHRETALLYPPGDAEKLAERVLELCDDLELYDRLAEQGRIEVEQHFSMDRVADRVAHLLRSAVGLEPFLESAPCEDGNAWQ